MEYIRFVTPVKSMYLLEKITCEEWCDNLTISSYFLDYDVMKQVAEYSLETIKLMPVQ